MEITTKNKNGETITVVAGKGADLSGLILNGVKFKNLDITEANFSNSSMVGCVFHNCNAEDANFSGAELPRTRFNKTILTDASMRGVDLRQVSMIDCLVDGIKFEGATVNEHTFIPNIEVEDETIL